MRFTCFKMCFETNMEYVVQQLLPLRFIFPDKNECLFNVFLGEQQEYADFAFLCTSAFLEQLRYHDGQRKPHPQR